MFRELTEQELVFVSGGSEAEEIVVTGTRERTISRLEIKEGGGPSADGAGGNSSVVVRDDGTIVVPRANADSSQSNNNNSNDSSTEWHVDAKVTYDGKKFGGEIVGGIKGKF